MATKPSVLCVDDEPNILSGLKLHLRRDYEVLTADSGEQALELLREQRQVAAIISDMRMPGMDGAAFLAATRKLVPRASRILLTGYADLDAAVRAVNQGQLFRFLTKPCAPDELQLVVRAAVAQQRLLDAERELLERTLFGSVEALSDTLMIAEPDIFGGIAAVRRLSEELGELAGLQPLWPLRLAAMLVFIGHVGMPREVAAKAVAGEALSREEARMVGEAPKTAARVLGHIPRLEPVHAILERADAGGEVAGLDDERIETEVIRQSAAILRVAIDFVQLTARGIAAEAAVRTLHGRSGRYQPQALELLRRHVGEAAGGDIVEIGRTQLRSGMVLVEDCRTRQGVLIAARGYVITESFLERIRNYKKGSVAEPLRVQLPAAAPAAVVAGTNGS